MSKSVSLYTLGCKLNYSETSTITGLFNKNGFKVKKYGEQSDIFVLNTCTVTENADKECRQIIRSVINNNPDTYIIVIGCYAQLKPSEIAEIKGVDLILGTNEKFKLFDYIENFEKKSYSCVFTSPANEITDFNYAYSSDIDSRTRAFLKIQDGCDYNCSFCTIPLARGGSRSLALPMVIENAKKLIDTGYKEIVLTGVNTGDYHYLSTNNGTSGKMFKLIDVLYELDKLDIPRIRISSIEPNLLTDEIIQLVKSSSKFCNHFHIPLQSGDNDILGSMRRRYNREMFRNLIHKLNEEIPGIGIGVDIIVGFPGETESRFENTLRFIDSLPVSYLHVFNYSERNNTYSVSLPEKVAIESRKKRSRILRELSVKKKYHFYNSHFGKIQNVLFETLKDNGNINGFTDNYIKIKMHGSAKMENKILPVRILNADPALFCNAELVHDHHQMQKMTFVEAV
jgi:threonylcarbamoyladenosine tRNA methylthiotransferase MtaB